MDYDEIFELFKQSVQEAMEDNVSFANIIDYENCKHRNIMLGTIYSGIGASIDATIRFWNKMDEDNNIPVEEREPIKLYIDSGGGSLTDTFTIIDAIRLSKTPVWTICTGCAYSGGFFSFISGHRRIAYPTASFMFHEGSTGNSCDAGKFRNYSEFYIKQLDKLKEITLKYTNISEEEYENKKKDDVWYFADEALSYSICDEIAEELI